MTPRVSPAIRPALMVLLSLWALPAPRTFAAERPEFGGVYPHLAYSNEHGECGTGAVVPWAGRLWVITYAPHLPTGSTDKLYEIGPDLEIATRPESLGGTPANRMIHRESQQLFIGPYAIDARANVRAIPYSRMYGRHTGTARHLTDPAGKVYYMTMEEGLYEVDVRTLEVTELYADEQKKQGNKAGLPGYHGKGLYSAQGLLVYANNGENSPEARRRPDIPSGCLASWDGKKWTVVRRNQFTEVTGPGGIEGNARPEDPLWSIGWDHRSLILMTLDGGRWHAYRLPKASHCYDGAHGWNTEWPRIRDIGEDDLLMTMHGTLWRFPRGFRAGRTMGITPRSTYLRVVGDFCRWNDRLVLGCDDAAQSEFLNKRRAKGEVAGPGRSQSNLWFVEPERLDRLGPVIGRGSVWMDDPVQAGEVSEPFLFSGYAKRSAYFAHDGNGPMRFKLEVDIAGDANWTPLREVEAPAQGVAWVGFSDNERGQWLRVRAERASAKTTVSFQYADEDARSTQPDAIFQGAARPGSTDYHGGVLRARGDKQGIGPLSFAVTRVEAGKVAGEAYYEMGADLKLRRVENAKDHAYLKKACAVPTGTLATEPASVLVIDDRGRRFRLPRGDSAFDGGQTVPLRVAREVVTERDLLNAHGSFYELPAENADGFAKLRPIATHNLRFTDYGSWRGMLVLAGAENAPTAASPRWVRSDDGQAAVWLGVVDELWRLGKPVGVGGPWLRSAVKAGVASDPYLMAGYDRKSLRLSHDAPNSLAIRIELDYTGNGHWAEHRTLTVAKGEELRYEFSREVQAYWVRLVASGDCTASGQFVYE